MIREKPGINSLIKVILDPLGVSTEEDLADRKNYYALSRVLFSLLDAIIDLADEIVAKDLGMPTTYRDIFSLPSRDGSSKRISLNRW